MAAIFKITVKDDGTAVVKGFNKNIKKTGKETKEAGDKAKKTTGSFKKLLGTLGNSTIFTATYKAIGKIVDVLKESGSAILDYEKGLKQIKGVTGATREHLTKLSKTVRDVGLDVEYSSDVVLKSALSYSRMGYNAENASHLIKASMDLVTASGVEQQIVIDTLGATIKSFGVSLEKDGSKKVERFANVIQTTTASTAADFESFGEAIKFVAPLSNAMNVGLEETSAIIGAMADTGLKGSLGGTAFKNMLIALLKPTESGSKALAKMNLEGKTFTQIMSELISTSSNADLAKIFNLRAIAPSLNFKDADFKKSLSEITEKLLSMEMQADKTAEEIRTSLSDQLGKLGSNIKNIGIEFYEAFSKNTSLTEKDNPINTLNEAVISFILYIREAPEELREVFLTIDYIVKAVNGIIQSSISIAKHLYSAFLVFNKVFHKAVDYGKQFDSFLMETRLKLGVFGKALKAIGILNPFALLKGEGLAFLGVVDTMNDRLDATMKKWSDISNEGIKKTNSEVRNLMQAFNYIEGDALDSYVKNLEAINKYQHEITRMSSEWKRYMDSRKGNDPSKFVQQSELNTLVKDIQQFPKLIDEYEAKIKYLDKLNNDFGKDQMVTFEQAYSRMASIVGSEEAITPYVNGLRVLFTDKHRLLNREVNIYLKTYLRQLKEVDKEVNKASVTPMNLDPNLVGGSGSKSKSFTKKFLNIFKDMGVVWSGDLKNSLDNVNYGKTFEELFTSFETKGRGATKVIALQEAQLKGLEETTSLLVKRNEELDRVLLGAGKSLKDMFSDKDGIEEFTNKMDSIQDHFYELKNLSRTASFEFKENMQKALNTMQIKAWEKSFENSLNRVSELMVGSNFYGLGVMSSSWKVNLSPIYGAISEFEALKRRVSNAWLDGTITTEQMLEATAVTSSMQKEVLSQAIGDSIDRYVELSSQGYGLLKDLRQQELNDIRDQHAEKLRLLSEERDAAISLAGDNTRRRIIIAQEYASKESQLKKKQEVEERAYMQKVKKWAVAEAYMNTFAAALGAFRDTRGGFLARSLGMALATTAGMMQVSKIQKQKFMGGDRTPSTFSGAIMDTMNTGLSDKYSIDVSGGEYVVNPQDVQAAGGFAGVQQSLEGAIDGYSYRGGGDTNIMIDTNIGSREFTRKLYEDHIKEGRRQGRVYNG